MREDGWVGRFIHGWADRGQAFQHGPSTKSVGDPDPRILLYDAKGQPLVKDRRAGFVQPERKP